MKPQPALCRLWNVVKIVQYNVHIRTKVKILRTFFYEKTDFFFANHKRYFLYVSQKTTRFLFESYLGHA